LPVAGGSAQGRGGLGRAVSGILGRATQPTRPLPGRVHRRREHPMATPTNTTQSRRLQVRRVFDAPPERLFQAWTTPEELRRWHAPGPLSCVLAEIDLRVG